MKVFFYALLVFMPVFFLNEAKAQQVGANIILNPSFDTDDAGWGHYFDFESGNATFRNNTSYWNSKSSFRTGGEMVCYNVHDIKYINNIAWANPAYSPENFAICDNGNWGANKNITWENNIAFNGTVGQSATYFNKTTTTSVDNTNKTGVDPLFISPTIVTALANFKLQTGSPAIDAGTTAYGVSAYDIDYAARIGGSGIDLGAYETSAGALPVSLLNFTAKRTGATTAVLNWNTTNELSFDFFEVERATDGQPFEKITNIKSGGAANNKYQYTDNNSIQGYTYYRLKMFGKEGRFTYSNVIAVASGTAGNNIGEVYPNPVSNGFAMIAITAQENGVWSVTAADVAGHISKLQNAGLVKGANQLKIDLSKLCPGTYFLNTGNNGKSYMKKIVKY